MNDPDNVTPEEPPIPAETVLLPSRGFTIDRRKALAAAAVLWAGYAFMVWAVANDRTGSFDQWGLLFYRTGDQLVARGPELLHEAVRDVTGLGGVFLRNLFAIAAVVALLFLKLRREAVLFAATVVMGWLVNSGMKALVGRPRPEIVPHLTEAGGASFPSGHSFNAAVVYIAMALAFASMSARHSVRYTIVGSAMILSAMIAWSRVMLGVHFPSDVAAGWLGGAGWAFLAAALLYAPAKAAADSETVQSFDPATH
ncbi:phosphatase PAP2 family protein [Tsuneonella sp. YG55]|uniref:Phosphatase PAP2 family protein n=1 Tax=Tsuneonella litorea TaxID=2976475 RepID=A0A9X3A8V3_9SPHN|nr:phosphatase PAP2 family protein [Tsuneonella litorea]MCT2558195.1 phosphatase PAP2 family protein [Tsuneonella litorea]